MGTLNEVYQLKPKALSGSAILKVRKDCQGDFLKSFERTDSEAKVEGIFSDTFLYRTNDGKVERLALYSPDRVIDFKQPGLYLSIRSDGKWGFTDPFVNGIGQAAPFLEDCLFFVIYDTRISRFEISGGKLHATISHDFDKWEYSFDKFVLSNYQDSPQIVADYFADKVTEVRLFFNYLSETESDPGSYYEVEDYEELLEIVVRFGSYLSKEALENTQNWLRETIAFQRDWEDKYYI